MELERFLDNNPKGFLIKGPKGSLIKGLNCSLIKGLKGSFIECLKNMPFNKLMEEYSLRRIEKLKDFTK